MLYSNYMFCENACYRGPWFSLYRKLSIRYIADGFEPGGEFPVAWSFMPQIA
jgi:hypothetical protein